MRVTEEYTVRQKDSRGERPRVAGPVRILTPASQRDIVVGGEGSSPVDARIAWLS